MVISPCTSVTKRACSALVQDQLVQPLEHLGHAVPRGRMQQRVPGQAADRSRPRPAPHPLPARTATARARPGTRRRSHSRPGAAYWMLVGDGQVHAGDPRVRPRHGRRCGPPGRRAVRGADRGQGQRGPPGQAADEFGGFGGQRRSLLPRLPPPAARAGGAAWSREQPGAVPGQGRGPSGFRVAVPRGGPGRVSGQRTPGRPPAGGPGPGIMARLRIRVQARLQTRLARTGL
jgi:hypothetical protein